MKADSTVAEFSVEELVEIQTQLLNLAEIPNTGLAWKCSKNAGLIGRIQRSYQKAIQKLDKDFRYKDEKGEDIKYQLEKRDGGTFFKLDDLGEPIPGVSEKGLYAYRVDKGTAYQEAVEIENLKTYPVSFHTIDANLVEELCNTKVIGGILFDKLLDTIIV